MPYMIEIEHGHAGFVGWLVNTVIGVCILAASGQPCSVRGDAGALSGRSRAAFFYALNVGPALRQSSSEPWFSRQPVWAGCGRSLLILELSRSTGIAAFASIAWQRASHRPCDRIFSRSLGIMSRWIAPLPMALGIAAFGFSWIVLFVAAGTNSPGPSFPALAWVHLVALGWITLIALSVLVHAMPTFLDVQWRLGSVARIATLFFATGAFILTGGFLASNLVTLQSGAWLALSVLSFTLSRRRRAVKQSHCVQRLVACHRACVRNDARASIDHRSVRRTVRERARRARTLRCAACPSEIARAARDCRMAVSGWSSAFRLAPWVRSPEPVPAASGCTFF